jgi:hypothetical protein
MRHGMSFVIGMYEKKEIIDMKKGKGLSGGRKNSMPA